MNNRYLRELKQLLHCSGRTRKMLLTKFQSQCREGLEENAADYEAMVRNFGPPAEFARILMEEVPAEETARYRTSRILLRVGAGVLAAVLLLVLFPLFRETSPIHAAVGDTIILGTYEQDNDLENGPEDIQWLVLYREGNRALVVSSSVLAGGRHKNYGYVDSAWDGSAIRTWLNGDFWNAAFTPEEQRWIPAGVDRVFLLSVEETEAYFPDEGSRAASPTAYAKLHGATSNWWLRTMRSGHGSFSYITYAGALRDAGLPYQTFGIRPAMWVECSPGN